MIITVSGTEDIRTNVKDYWERSVLGFGEYSQEISKNVYIKHISNNSVGVHTTNYRFKVKEVGDGYFLFINKY